MIERTPPPRSRAWPTQRVAPPASRSAPRVARTARRQPGRRTTRAVPSGHVARPRPGTPLGARGGFVRRGAPRRRRRRVRARRSRRVLLPARSRRRRSVRAIAVRADLVDRARPLVDRARRPRRPRNSRRPRRPRPRRPRTRRPRSTSAARRNSGPDLDGSRIVPYGYETFLKFIMKLHIYLREPGKSF